MKSTTQSTKAEEAQAAATGTTSTAAEDIATMQKLGFDNFSAMGTTWAETMSELGSEVVSFMAERIREDVKTQHEILHCKNMSDLQKIQARFMQKAIDQYTAETGKLVEMSQTLFAPARKGPDA
ncbi:phasin family protein [Pontivivens ytuae]|uniref:Phasin family protein n=1 Tax=Pontivivens ytuae TaxID=2789856 RepID=A0A7S9QBN9_9RHOB|nr:phasin family protein [Pontivivens ytuae]QPH52940.1 phasin family protein [Pontivivens ytuae]